MRSRHRAAALAALVPLLAACGVARDLAPNADPSATPAAVTEGPWTTPPQSSPATTGDIQAPADEAPLLQLTQNCYGLCIASPPLGLPAVTLYVDGQVVSSQRIGTSVRPTLTTGTVSSRDVRRLVGLARQAQLTGGGSTTLGFRGRSYADGGGEVLTARLAGRTTTVESPQAYDAEADVASTDPEQRRALRLLSDALEQLRTPDPYPSSRVVVRAEPRPGQVGRVWTGPDLAALPMDGDGRCAVLSGEPGARALEAVQEDAFPSSYSDVGRVWIVAARPALPHERDCADVGETVRTSTGSGSSG